MFGLKDRVFKAISDWLTLERPPDGLPLYDYERMAHELRPGDALLVEGRTRVGSVIKTISESPWTHSALYIGCLHDVDDPEMRKNLLRHYDGNPSTQLLVEAVMGQGTILTPLEAYRDNHMRICRPTGLSRKDAQKVIGFVIRRLGADYDVRQLLDLARFLFPYALIPRTWRSVLFQHNAGGPTRTVCSTLMAEAFGSVNFPVLPVIEKDASGKLTFYHRNPRLFAPRDFDYSPYFDIIKYPFVAVSAANYQDLPWEADGVFCNSAGDCYTVASPGRELPPAIPLHRINLLARVRLRPAREQKPGNEVSQTPAAASQQHDPASAEDSALSSTDDDSHQRDAA
jgi:hypothetical protein